MPSGIGGFLRGALAAGTQARVGYATGQEERKQNDATAAAAEREATRQELIARALEERHRAQAERDRAQSERDTKRIGFEERRTAAEERRAAAYEARQRRLGASSGNGSGGARAETPAQRQRRLAETADHLVQSAGGDIERAITALAEAQMDGDEELAELNERAVRAAAQRYQDSRRPDRPPTSAEVMRDVLAEEGAPGAAPARPAPAAGAPAAAAATAPPAGPPRVAGAFARPPAREAAPAPQAAQAPRSAPAAAPVASGGDTALTRSLTVQPGGTLADHMHDQLPVVSDELLLELIEKGLDDDAIRAHVERLGMRMR